MSNKKDKPQKTPDQSIRSYQYMGAFLLVLLIGGIGGWAAFASLQGAVIATAQITVKAHLKMVQHLEGGIVSAILVEEGQKVNKGDTLLRLDTTKDAANLAALDSNLNELIARHARLIAERDDAKTISFEKQQLLQSKTNPTIAAIITGQRNLKKARLSTIEGQTKQLHQRIEQLDEVVNGLRAQTNSKKRQLELIKKELRDLSTLKEKGLVPQTRLLSLEREQARLEGELGELTSNTARTKVQISETEIQILQIKKEQLSTILGELRETTTKANELKEQRTALADKLHRMEIKAPKTGVIHKLSVHTISGVVAPGDPVLMIVPENSTLILAAHVDPADIDQIYKGQIANVRLSAFDQRTTPEITGKVSLVSGDATQDQANTPPYYMVHIELSEAELKKLDGKQLVPGMNAEVFIQTKSRPVFEYLLQPLTDQIRRAMREP